MPTLFDPPPGYEGLACITTDQQRIETAVFYLIHQSYRHARHALIQGLGGGGPFRLVGYEACSGLILQNGLEDTCQGPFPLCLNDNLRYISCGNEVPIGFDGMCNITDHITPPPMPTSQPNHSPSTAGTVAFGILIAMMFVGAAVVIKVMHSNRRSARARLAAGDEHSNQIPMQQRQHPLPPVSEEADSEGGQLSPR